MATALGRSESLFLSSSSSKSVRTATIKIRFADIIVKSKYRKLIQESNNKSEAILKIKKQKQILQRNQLREKARIESIQLRRQHARLALEKMEEEASTDMKFEHQLSDVKELVNLCGGSHRARSRSWLKHLGLTLRVDDLLDDDVLDDLEEGEIV